MNSSFLCGLETIKKFEKVLRKRHAFPQHLPGELTILADTLEITFTQKVESRVLLMNTGRAISDSSPETFFSSNENPRT